MPFDRIRRFGSRPDTAIWLVAAAASMLLIAWGLLSSETMQTLMLETGPFERSSPWLYLTMAVAVVLVRPRGMPVLSALAIAVAATAFAAREWDLLKVWTDDSVLKVSFYLNEAPWSHTIVAMTVVLLILLALLWLALRHGRTAWRAFRHAEPWAMSVMTFILLMVATKLIDRAQNVLLETFGIAFSPSLGALNAAMEEGLETVLPLLMGLALWQAHGRAR